MRPSSELAAAVARRPPASVGVARATSSWGSVDLSVEGGGARIGWAEMIRVRAGSTSPGDTLMYTPAQCAPCFSVTALFSSCCTSLLSTFAAFRSLARADIPEVVLVWSTCGGSGGHAGMSDDLFTFRSSGARVVVEVSVRHCDASFGASGGSGAEDSEVSWVTRAVVTLLLGVAVGAGTGCSFLLSITRRVVHFGAVPCGGRALWRIMVASALLSSVGATPGAGPSAAGSSGGVATRWSGAVRYFTFLTSYSLSFILFVLAGWQRRPVLDGGCRRLPHGVRFGAWGCAAAFGVGAVAWRGF